MISTIIETPRISLFVIESGQYDNSMNMICFTYMYAYMYIDMNFQSDSRPSKIPTCFNACDGERRRGGFADI